MKYPALIFATVVLVLLGGCEQQDSLARIQERGELIVVSRNSPTTYYVDKNGPTGFEYALAAMLAQALNVELRMETAYNVPSVFARLKRQSADIAAAGLTLTEERAAVFPHSIPYYQLTPQVIYVIGGVKPTSLTDLADNKIAVLAGSSHARMLEMLKRTELPNLVWEEVDEADATQVLEHLHDEEATLAILGSHEFAMQQAQYPKQQVAFDLGRKQDMVWYLTPGVDNARLLAFIDNFIAGLRQDGRLERLRQQYFGHTDGVSRIGAAEFSQHIDQTLPTYLAAIQQAADEFEMDWHLLAAIAYQESQWNPTATSRTGVRGMMMLTEATARELGVDNRLNVNQSLRGGARYLKDIKRRLPAAIHEPDRTWLALAAYNIGLTHLEDARKLTQKQGGDPNLWLDVMQRLPLLQKTHFYKDTHYGYARGMEAVRLVQNIRHYYSVLAWQEIPETQPHPPLRADEYVPAALRNLELQAL